MGQEDTTEATQTPSIDETSTPPVRVGSRRRASRAAGPPSAVDVGPAPAQAGATKPAATKARVARPVGPPPRRQPNRGRVAIPALVVLAVLALVLAGSVALLTNHQRDVDAAAARDQRFVDTASQTVVNMFSYTQNTIDESVNRFVDGISGPLRDMMSQGKNVDNLKAIFRDTQANSEAVINGAALEKVDEVAKNAAVLVAVRVTITDLNGVNEPSKPYRLRVIVHEDDDGHMTGYDLKYPEGGN